MKKNNKENLVSILDFKKQPFVFLEGGTGLNIHEEYISLGLFNRGYDVYVLDNLYEKTRKLASIQFLEVKTIILGTTGVYRDKLNILLDLFFSLELENLENIILTLSSTEYVLWNEMKILKKKYKNVKFWEIDSFIDDKNWDECNLIEIKV